MQSNHDVRKQLKNRLSPMRYEHSLSVSFTCMSLAMRYGYDMNKAELAGLMHDCGKRFSDEVILKKCLKHGIPVTESENKALAVLHAKYGAWLAENKYQIRDEEILSAIACHTTGKPDMTTLDKILYIADYIEPRALQGGESSGNACHGICGPGSDHVCDPGRHAGVSDQKGQGSIDPMTREAHIYFKQRLESKGELNGSV